MALIYNATFDKNTRKLSFEDRAGNEIYSFIVPERVSVDDITKPLTFKATQDGSTVKLTKWGSPDGAFQTSRDGGSTWEDYTIDTAIILNTGDEVSFRAKADRTSNQTTSNRFRFMMEGKIEAWHNVMSLYRTNDFATYMSGVEYAFYHLFKDCTSLTKAPVLPATTLVYGFYTSMFSGCTSLTKAPALPATTLAVECYKYMFYNCSSLTEAPVLSATTLANDCYGYMFYGCSSLNEVHCDIPSSYSSSDISTSYAKDWLYNVSSTGTFYTNADAQWPSGASGIPTGWNRVNEGAPTVDDITKPLTFRATQDGSTVKLTKIAGSPSGTFQTSRDGGNTWTDYTIDTAIALNTGDEVSFRTSADRTSSQSNSNYFGFQMTGKIEAWHNAMSLYRTNDFATYNTSGKSAFYRLFRGCTSLTKAPALPATTLENYCYQTMFSDCTSLTKAPALPATTLADYCYDNMFRGCTSLSEAPELPATTLADYCYQSMFYGCTSLTKAPALPATTLADYCYCHMFNGCTSLTKAPELPETKLSRYCYQNMFDGCTSLAEAPVLPATTLYSGCYFEMFKGCTSLTKAPVLPATTLANYCYDNMFNGCSSLNEVRCQMPSSYSGSAISSTYAENWLSGVSSTGTFYTNADANWSSGANGIPEGWNRVNT